MFRELRAQWHCEWELWIVSRGFVIIIVIRALRSNGIHPPWIKTGVWHVYLGMFDAALFLFPRSGFFLAYPSREAKMHLSIRWKQNHKYTYVANILILCSNKRKASIHVFIYTHNDERGPPSTTYVCTYVYAAGDFSYLYLCIVPDSVLIWISQHAY